MDKYIGKRLGGRYEIQELIGIGGMANVYKAKDLIDDITVAVKILKDEYLSNEEFLRRFKNEAKAIAGLSHPNIVKVFDVIYSETVPAIVMEHIDGITLKEYIEREGVLKWKESVHYVVQVLRALQHAHDKGIVHRDIKPQNIMLLMDGTIKVMDFGIARFARFETKTMSDKVIGSVHYISPEQACGDVTDHKTDIYSVGVILFEMLTGQLPFEADAPVSVVMMQVSKTPKRPREINETIPEGLEEITIKAMQKNPAMRYQSAAEMLRDIDDFKKNPSIQFAYKYFTDENPTKHFNAVAPVTEAEGEEDEEPKKKSAVLPILLGITSAVVLGVIIFLIFLIVRSDLLNPTPARIIPDMVGMTFQEAKEKNKDLEFDVVQKAYRNDIEKDVIFKQDPEGGKSVKSTKVKLWISLGPETGVVPDVTKYDVTAAKETLRQKGFTEWIEIQEFNIDVPEGYVVRTDPERGVEAPLNTKVTIFIAKKKEEYSKVPNLVNLMVDQAKNVITSRNFAVGEIAEVPSDKPKGTVIYQDVLADTMEPDGTKINLQISSGKPAQVSFAADVPLPTFMTNEVELKATLNGVSIQTAKMYPSEAGKWTVSLTGNGTAKLIVRIDNKIYQEYDVNFNEKKIVITKDNTDDFRTNSSSSSSSNSSNTSSTSLWPF